MHEYQIVGGYPVSGTVEASGNKNAALPCIAASMLTAESVTLRGMPEIEDTAVMMRIAQSLGATVEKLDAAGGKRGAWRITAANVTATSIPQELTKKIRASILFAGALLARCGRAEMAPPGGDVIGRRRLDTHFLALTELGGRVETAGRFVFTANKLIGADIFLDEMSVTATENALMAAVLAEGDTTLSNAASEPHIQDLCNMLVAMGASIEGIGSNVLRIHGAASLHGCDFSIGPDYMEIGSFIGLAAATHGTLKITGVKEKDMRPLRTGFSKLGISWTLDSGGAANACSEDGGCTLTVPASQVLTVKADIDGSTPRIDDAPWPGFPPDLTSIMVVTATQVDGTVLVFEKMFESRMFFVDKLISMGACITLCDPHRAVIVGPRRLHGEHLVSPDVRAGMAMVIAACCAHGTSRISNVYQIERGYEHLVERLKSIGVHIERVEC